MTASGKITFVDKVSGATELSASASSGTSVLLVGDAGDFDEEFLEPRYLAIGDDLIPHEYVAVENEDGSQQSVTLAGTAGAAYEAGLPVYLWDPEADGEDKRAVSVDAQVRLDGQDEAVPVTIRHALAPQAYSLTGATVTIEDDDDGDPFVEEVRSRKSTITGTTIQTAEEGQRVVVRPFQLGDSQGGVVEFFTDHPDEDYPGSLFGYQTDLGGGLYTLQTVLYGPGIPDSAAPSLQLSATMLGPDPATFLTGNADKIQFNAESLTLSGDRIEADNFYVLNPPKGSFSTNVNIGPGGQLREITSALRFKRDVEDAEVDPAAVLNLRPRAWRDKGDDDTRYVGFIAEEVHEAGFTELVTYEDDGRPRGLNYDRFTVPLLELARSQEARIAALEAQVQELLSRQ